MLKGKSVIELTDAHTGKKEHYEDTNLVTEAAMDILNVIRQIKRCLFRQIKTGLSEHLTME